MALFSSRSPYDIVRTPEDDALIQNGDFREEEVYGLIPSKFYNPVNPILAEFREEYETLGRIHPKDWLRVCNTAFWSYSEDRDDFIDHARRVLTRLFNLQKES